MGTEYILDTDIPVPRSGAGRPTKYPWRSMTAGQSVYIPDGKLRARNSVYHHCTQHPDQRWTTRFDGDGLRVWRLA